MQEIIDHSEAAIRIVSLTMTEFARRMAALGQPRDQILAALKSYGRIWEEVVHVDETIAMEAFSLGEATKDRLPLVDALIAGAARLTGSLLVHRDPHFKKVPAGLVSQEILPDLKS